MENSFDIQSQVIFEKLQAACSRIEEELIGFVCSKEFRRVLEEISALPEHLRHEFVEVVLLDDEQLAARGIRRPNGLHLQRSYFSDRRPTLFCVTKELPPGLLWKKITITFDNETLGLPNPPFACRPDGSLLPSLGG